MIIMAAHSSLTFTNLGTISFSECQFSINPDWNESPHNTWYDANMHLHQHRRHQTEATEGLLSIGATL